MIPISTIGTGIVPPNPVTKSVYPQPLNPIDLAIRQHMELLEKIAEVNRNLRAIQLAPITIVYLICVSVFFYLGKVNEWVWVGMTLYPLTPIYGDRFLKFLFDMQRRR